MQATASVSFSPQYNMPQPRNQRKQGKSKGRVTVFKPSPLTLNPSSLPRASVIMAIADPRNLTQTAVGTTVYGAWSLNGVWDPYVTGSGNQPPTFDYVMAMYNRYRVTETKVEVTFANTTANTVNVGMMPYYDATLPTLASSILVTYGTKNVVLGSVAGNAAVRRLTAIYKPWEVLEVSKESYMADLDYSGTRTANPTKQAFLLNYARGFSVIANVDAIVRIAYRVELFDPVALPDSAP